MKHDYVKVVNYKRSDCCGLYKLFDSKRSITTPD